MMMGEKQKIYKIERFVTRMRKLLKQTMLRTGDSFISHSMQCSEVIAVLLDHMMESYSDREKWENREWIILSGRSKLPAFSAGLVEYGLSEVEIENYQMLDSLKAENNLLKKIICYDENKKSFADILSAICVLAMKAKLYEAEDTFYLYMGVDEQYDKKFEEVLKYAVEKKLDNIIYIANVQESNVDCQVKFFHKYKWNILLADKGNVEEINYELYCKPKLDGLPTILLCVEKEQGGSYFEEKDTCNSITKNKVIPFSMIS